MFRHFFLVLLLLAPAAAVQADPHASPPKGNASSGPTGSKQDSPGASAAHARRRDVLRAEDSAPAPSVGDKLPGAQTGDASQSKNASQSHPASKGATGSPTSGTSSGNSSPSSAATSPAAAGPRILVNGQVNHPGWVTLAGNKKTTLVSVLDAAGGLAPGANPVVVVERKLANGKVQRFRIDYRSARGDPQKDLLLKPGDVIMVSKTITVGPF